MPQEGISGFGGEALKRVFLKVCNVFLVSKQHFIFIYPANVMFADAHTRHTHTHSQTCLDQRNVKTEYAEPQTIRLEVFIYEPEGEFGLFGLFKMTYYSFSSYILSIITFILNMYKSS